MFRTAILTMAAAFAVIAAVTVVAPRAAEAATRSSIATPAAAVEHVAAATAEEMAARPAVPNEDTQPAAVAGALTYVGEQGGAARMAILAGLGLLLLFAAPSLRRN